MATAAITGTATPSIRIPDIVAGGKTIIITLTGDTWVAAGATFDAQRQNIINGIDSAQAEANGWDAQVKANLAVTTVVRTSNTIVTVTLSAQAAYTITALETITVTVPASAVTGAAQIVATPTFVCIPSPATFYVGSGGADTNAGNSWATRRLTIQSAVTSAVVAADTIYVAPGTYRETVTMGASGTAGNVISLIGDYTGANTSGTKGVVRITGSNDDNTNTRANCVSITSLNYLTISGFEMDGCTSHLISLSSATYITITKCSFNCTTTANFVASINVSGASQSNVTISNCLFYGVGYYILRFTHGSTVDNCNHSISNCIVRTTGFSGGGAAIYNDRIGGVSVKNSYLSGNTAGINLATAPSVGQTMTVNNCVFHLCGTAMAAPSTGYLVEDYNCIALCSTARSNVTAGSNSVSRFWLPDTRWFFEAVLASGTLVTPFDLASYSTLVEYNSGTGAPSTDMRGASVVGTYREWGALEYNSTLGIAGGGGGGSPIGSRIIRGIGAM